MIKEKFARDLFVLMAVIVLLASYSFIGFIHWTMSLLFLILYIGFIGYVIYTEIKNKKKEENPIPLLDDSADNKLLAIKDKESHPPASDIDNKQIEEEPKELLKKLKKDAIEILEATYYIDEYKHMTLIGKLLFMFAGSHFELLLKLSIPPFDEKKWDRRLAVLFPIFGGLLTFVQLKIFNGYVLLVVILISISLSVLMYFITEPKKAPKFLLILMLIAFIQSVQWMWFLCNISVDIFKLYVELTDVEPAYVGLTFMAAANSIGDIISDITMAKLGFSVMAITAAFAGPIFNIMMGIGITTTHNIIKR